MNLLLDNVNMYLVYIYTCILIMCLLYGSSPVLFLLICNNYACKNYNASFYLSIDLILILKYFYYSYYSYYLFILLLFFIEKNITKNLQQ